MFRLCFLETPAIENGWHGNPAVSRSWSGTSDASTSLMSPAGGSPKLVSYVWAENLFHSELYTHLPPSRSSAILIPPIPAKRSMNLNVAMLCNGTRCLVSKMGFRSGSAGPCRATREELEECVRMACRMITAYHGK